MQLELRRMIGGAGEPGVDDPLGVHRELVTGHDRPYPRVDGFAEFLGLR
jgi:hypothetical protein